MFKFQNEPTNSRAPTVALLSVPAQQATFVLFALKHFQLNASEPMPVEIACFIAHCSYLTMRQVCTCSISLLFALSFFNS
jgi:hypothetical protein